MNVISFSLFGKIDRYFDGIAANKILMEEVYPGWEMILYYDRDAIGSRLGELQSLGAHLIPMSLKRGVWEGLFWRFLPVADSGFERVLVRDLDSRVNVRELAAVDEWIASGLPFHVMRDHPAHQSVIMGGMWGSIGGAIPDMRELIAAWNAFSSFGSDQYFLSKIIWPRMQGRVLSHDSHPSWAISAGVEARIQPFPTTAPIPGRFVGAKF